MNRINLKELNKQQDMLEMQLKNNEELANFCVITNKAFIDLKKRLDDIGLSFIFHSHIFGFEAYKYNKDESESIFSINGNCELYYSSDAYVDIANEALEIIMKEFF